MSYGTEQTAAIQKPPYSVFLAYPCEVVQQFKLRSPQFFSVLRYEKTVSYLSLEVIRGER